MSMIIDKKVFPVGYHTQLSFLRLTNVTTVKDAEIILFDLHAFETASIDTIQNFIDLKKIIYIDSTYELLENSILEKLDRFDKIDSIYYFYNPTDIKRDLTLLSNLVKRGLVCVTAQYFIDYADIYKPTTNSIPVPEKSYLCLTGKVNPARTFLIALLSRNKLLQHGHVSYFGENYIDQNFDKTKIDEYRDVHIFSPIGKNIIREELEQIQLPLVADIDYFNSALSHTKDFNADLYNAVDFVIVPETMGCVLHGHFFPTEKTIKCINLNKKFIPVASQGFLRKLKSYYMTKFNKDISNLTDWYDNSFDDHPSLEERISSVVKIAADEISKGNK
jgi:hypothetical protein